MMMALVIDGPGKGDVMEVPPSRQICYSDPTRLSPSLDTAADPTDLTDVFADIIRYRLGRVASFGMIIHVWYSKPEMNEGDLWDVLFTGNAKECADYA